MIGRRGVTLIEILVVVSVLATLIAVIAFAPPVGKQAGSQEPPASWNLYTAKHDGHWFVKDAAGGVCHHPDCPCQGRTAERPEGE